MVFLVVQSRTGSREDTAFRAGNSDNGILKFREKRGEFKKAEREGIGGGTGLTGRKGRVGGIIPARHCRSGASDGENEVGKFHKPQIIGYFMEILNN
jgi:hypothetical protein